MAGQRDEKADIFAVSRAAGVSISTVSRCFNHPGLVKPATRKKVEDAVRRLGYIRNRSAQVMHGRRSGTIGFVVPTIDNAIFAELIQSFSDGLDQQGFTMLIATHGFDLKREYAMVRKLMEHRVDGLALIGLEHFEPTFRLIEQQDIPVLTVWNYDDDARLSCVGVENTKAGRMAARHLMDLGHREVGLVFPSLQGNDRARGRLMGALGELRRAGIEPRADWRLQAPYSIAEAKTATMPILGRTPRPTAILCGNDVIAQGVLYAARHVGLKVPEDLSIMGIGDFKGASEIEPALSTIRIPARRIGSLAAHSLTREISDPQRRVTAIKCEPRLLIRATTAQPPPGSKPDQPAE